MKSRSLMFLFSGIAFSISEVTGTLSSTSLDDPSRSATILTRYLGESPSGKKRSRGNTNTY